MDLKKYVSHDLMAGVVVFLIALPLCLGIALASGAPLFSGIIAGVVGGIVAGSLSKSPLSVSGPAAGLTTIVLASIHDLGYPAFLLSVVLAGLFQLLLGYLRAGSIGDFFPASVIKGMLASIGLILILKQLPHAVGYDADFEGDENFIQADSHNTISELLESLQAFSGGAIVIAALSLVILIVWSSGRLQRYKFFQFVPAPLIVVILGIVANLVFENYIPGWAIQDKHRVSLPIISNISELGSSIILPDINSWLNPKVYLTALTIAIVASLETLLNIGACDKMDPYRRITPLNRELKAQGAANIISGLLGGLPVTSVVVRSSANVNAGAKTKASAITHGVILLVSVLLIPAVLQQIPLACLAGVLIYTGFKLTPVTLYKTMYQKGFGQFLPFIVTVVAVLFSNLLLGVFLGLLVAVFFILKTNFQRAVIVVTQDNQFLMRFTKDVSFLNKSTLREIFHKIPPNASVVIDKSQANFIDTDIKEIIDDFIEMAKLKNIQIELKRI